MIGSTTYGGEKNQKGRKELLILFFSSFLYPLSSMMLVENAIYTCAMCMCVCVCVCAMRMLIVARS